MKVPYAKQWQQATDELRGIALECGLVEQTKWSKPCFTCNGGNVVIIIPLKETVAFSFFKGALLQDPRHLLQKVGEHTQSGRWIRFTSLREIMAQRATLKRYVRDAIAVEKSGKKVAFRKPADYPVPAELQARLDASAKLRAAFAALTPGRQRSYFLHIAGARQAQTRQARVERCVPIIMEGRGFNEPPSRGKSRRGK